MKGRRRWVRNTTLIRDNYIASAAAGSIDMILQHRAYREVPVPTQFDRDRIRVWLVPDFDHWYNKPIDWNHLAMGVRAEDHAIFNTLYHWMVEVGMLPKEKKEGVK